MPASQNEILEGEIVEGEASEGAFGRQTKRRHGWGQQRTSRQEKTVRANFWKTFGKAAAQLPFAEDVVAAYFCALDPQSPRRVRITLLGAMAYFVLPVDTVPDFLAFVGFSDDVAVLTAAIAAVRSDMTPAHRLAARQALEAASADETENQS